MCPEMKVKAISWVCDSGNKGLADVYQAFWFQKSIKCNWLEQCMQNN
jgi:hypothetical protein